ncbi:PocR ligand-binding domain-containing protein [Amedibacillus sp. YH-ame10]
MEAKTILKKVLDDYRRITGLRSYIVYEEGDVQSASEKNYFCKCLKLSGKALEKCEECTKETFAETQDIDKECIYSCHAGLIKWAVPVNFEDYRCVIVSEGIIAQKQMEEAEQWAKYLSKEYKLNEDMVLRNFKVIHTMNEAQMKASIELLKDLIDYHYAMNK